MVTGLRWPLYLELDLKLSGSAFGFSMTLFAYEVQSHWLNETRELTRMIGLAIDLNYLELTDKTRRLWYHCLTLKLATILSRT